MFQNDRLRATARRCTRTVILWQEMTWTRKIFATCSSSSFKPSSFMGDISRWTPCSALALPSSVRLSLVRPRAHLHRPCPNGLVRPETHFQPPSNSDLLVYLPFGNGTGMKGHQASTKNDRRVERVWGRERGYFSM